MSPRRLPVNSKYNKALLLSVISLLLLSFISVGISNAEINGDLPLWLHEQLGTDPEDPRSPGVYVVYKSDYRTLNYNSWKTYEDINSTGSITIATERVVVRRGTELEIGGYIDADASIAPSKSGMTPLQIDTNQNGWTVNIPQYCSVGKYIFNLNQGNWTEELEIFVIYDPWTTGIPEEKLKAYAYDEESVRAEKDYIITTGYSIHEGTLRPFGDERAGWIDMYEFALAATAGSEDTMETTARLVRVVAQRGEAIPSPMHQQPIIRDASQILFGNGTTVLHGEQYNYTGLTLQDAEVLGTNGQTIKGIDGLTEDGETKLINAWCDEVSWALTSMLRAVGIPARVASIHPSQDTKLMGHFMVEVWLEESLYQTDWDDNDGGWYVIDADEWNAEWYIEEDHGRPIFWMPAGECFSSRSNYRRVVELLFMDEYKIEKVFVPGIDEVNNPDDFVDVFEYYVGDEFLLDYGTITKIKGRGAGDLFKVELRTNSLLRLESSPQLNASLYVSEEDYPAIPIAWEGYPFPGTVDHLYGDEVILGSGTYYVGVYAPNNGDPDVEGDFGTYSLTLERTPHLEPTFVSEDVAEEAGTDIQGYHGQIIGFLLLGIWIFAYVLKKKTSNSNYNK